MCIWGGCIASTYVCRSVGAVAVVIWGIDAVLRCAHIRRASLFLVVRANVFADAMMPARAYRHGIPSVERLLTCRADGRAQRSLQGPFLACTVAEMGPLRSQIRWGLRADSQGGVITVATLSLSFEIPGRRRPRPGKGITGVEMPSLLGIASRARGDGNSSR